MTKPDKQTTDLAQILSGCLSELSQQGINPTPVELIMLVRASERLQRPSGAEDYPAAGRPFKAGNFWFWPLTQQASRWYSRVVDWFSDDLKRSVLAFALVHSRTVGMFCYLESFDKAHSAVVEFADELAATVDEIDAAIDACLSQLPTQGEDDEDAPYDAHDSGGVDTTAMLQMHYGQTAEYWQSVVSVAHINRALRTVSIQADATGNEIRRIPQLEATGCMGRLLSDIEHAHAEDAA